MKLEELRNEIAKEELKRFNREDIRLVELCDFQSLRDLEKEIAHKSEEEQTKAFKEYFDELIEYWDYEY